MGLFHQSFRIGISGFVPQPSATTRVWNFSVVGRRDPFFSAPDTARPLSLVRQKSEEPATRLFLEAPAPIPGGRPYFSQNLPLLVRRTLPISARSGVLLSLRLSIPSPPMTSPSVHVGTHPMKRVFLSRTRFAPAPRFSYSPMRFFSRSLFCGAFSLSTDVPANKALCGRSAPPSSCS